MNYREALDAPIPSKGGRGWKYAGEQSAQAAAAQAIANLNCLQPEGVYDWAEKHSVRMIDRSGIKPPDWELIEAVLNDEPLPERSRV